MCCWLGVVGCGDVVSNPDAPTPADARVDAAVQIDAPSTASCQTLTPPAYGTVSTTNNNNFPSTATYTCGTGFNMLGSGTRTCAATGTWSDSAPTCAWIGALNFTTCTQTGNVGPTQALCDTAYTGTGLATHVTVPDGIQRWTVPGTGIYRITASGAAGSSIGGWLGARMQGDFMLTQGTVLKILVGQQPQGSLAGGGGTFVTDSANTPLIIAGGGGSGNCATHCVAAEAGGRIETTGGTMTGVARATAGDGGVSGNGPVSGAGGGLLTGGTMGGLSFVNGGTGAVGMAGYAGGFGGGGARNAGNGTGGGGGFSGGASNSNGADTTLRFGGGGGSFSSGTNQMNMPNINVGEGTVTITVP